MHPFVMTPHTVHKEVKHVHTNVKRVKWHYFYIIYVIKEETDNKFLEHVTTSYIVYIPNNVSFACLLTFISEV
jgi:hypothetical protein